jgi:lipid-A-disaccharide synthase
VPKILISAGELSAERYAAKLVTELKKRDPNLRFVGMGHAAMESAGVDLRADLISASTVGLLEPLVFLPRIVRAYRTLVRLLDTERPDVVVVVDFQGFHMAFLKAVKKRRIPAVYYIAPQEWQWGTEAGGRQVVALTDLILAIFPPEAAFFERLGGHVAYVGHPLADMVVPSRTGDEVRTSLNLSAEGPVIGIFPGSRPQEIKHVLPEQLAAAAKLYRHNPQLQFVISISTPLYADRIRKRVAEYPKVPWVFYTGPSANLIQVCTFSLAVSGTITLEHALLGVPTIVCYRFSAWTFPLIHWILKKRWDRVRYISLPNLLLDGPVLPELIQKNCSANRIAEAASKWLSNVTVFEAVKGRLREIRPLLGEGQATAHAADLIYRLSQHVNDG